MNTFLIYIGVIVAILVGAVFAFKPEFLMITGTKNLNSRIMSITSSGDLVLSDNTVNNINYYIEKMKTDLEKKIVDSVNTEKGEREKAVNATNRDLTSLIKNVKNNYVRYEDEMQIAGTYGCGDYKNISTYVSDGWYSGVVGAAPKGPNDPNARFVIRKRCGGCDTNSGARNKALNVQRGNSAAHGCAGF